MTAPGGPDLGLADLLLITLFSPAVEHGFGQNDGVDELLAGADLVEAVLAGERPGRRRDAVRRVRALSHQRRDREVARLTTLGLVRSDDAEHVVVKLPGRRGPGLGRASGLVFTDPEVAATWRQRAVACLRDPDTPDPEALLLALLADAGPWLRSRLASGAELEDVRDRARRIRRGKDTAPGLVQWAAARGVDAADVLTAVDATRVAIRASRSL